ncbi:MAG TPA: tetratricopeptide repeat protein, partial [Pirellulaceae bacterium]
KSKGDFSTAEAQYLEAIRLFRKVGGDQSPMLASGLDALGNMYRQQSKLALAREALEESFAIRQAILPAEDVLLALSLNNLALCFFDLGDFDGASARFQQALKIVTEARGTEHPLVAPVMSNLAGVETALGHFDAAAKLLRDALDMSVSAWGKDHVRTAAARHNLAKALTGLGEYSEAEELLRDALKTRVAQLGEQDLSVALSRDALAYTLRKAGKIDEAEALNQQAVLIFRQRKDQPLSLAFALSNGASIASDRGDYRSAMDHIQEAIELAGKVLPKVHWQIAQMRSNRGTILLRLDDLDAAEPVLRESHQVLLETLGPDHPSTREAAQHLAEIARKQKVTAKE